MDKVIVADTKFEFCPQTRLPIYCKVTINIDATPVVIEVDWRNNLNQKISYIKYGDEKIMLHHSKQCIILKDKTINCETMERMNAHYYNFYKNFKENSNYINSLKIHKILFKVRDKYDKN